MEFCVKLNYFEGNVSFEEGGSPSYEGEGPNFHEVDALGVNPIFFK